MTPTPQYVKDLTHGYSHIATSVFVLLFHEILDHHAPIRSIKVHGKPNPCITEETHELIKSRTIGAREHPELIIPLTGLLTKILNTK